MGALSQIKFIGIVFFIGQHIQSPALRIGETVIFHFLKRNPSVDHDFSGNIDTTHEILFCIHGNVIVTVLRHFKLPFDPLTGQFPGVSSDGVVQQRAGADRINRRGGLILLRVQHLRGGTACVFRFDTDGHTGSFLCTFLIPLCFHFFIGFDFFCRCKRNLIQQKGLSQR